MNPFIISLVVLTIFSASVRAEDNPRSSSKKDMSYALGVTLATNLKDISHLIEAESVVSGLRAGLALSDKRLSEQQLKAAMADFQRLLKTADQKQFDIDRQKNTAEAQQYLSENAKKQGVITTESGLQYQFQHLGSGKKPKATDSVEVHYRGTFIDGQEFDSSYKRNQTATFALNQVIAGWTEVLQLMPLGSKVKVAIPGHLAYGDNGRPPIGPNRTLLFDIELISIQ